MDVGQDTSLGNGHASEELVELFVVPDGELDQNLVRIGELVLMWRGTILERLLSLAAFPASSSSSAVRYQARELAGFDSRTAAR